MPGLWATSRWRRMNSRYVHVPDLLRYARSCLFLTKDQGNVELGMDLEVYWYLLRSCGIGKGPVKIRWLPTGHL